MSYKINNIYYIKRALKLHNRKIYKAKSQTSLQRVETKKRSEIVEIIVELASKLSEDQKREVLDRLLAKKEGFPISIFRSDLSGLEAIVFYLKEIKAKNITEIAALLKRKKSTIYTTHQKAKKKLKNPLDSSDYSVAVPYQTFSNRKFSVL